MQSNGARQNQDLRPGRRAVRRAQERRRSQPGRNHHPGRARRTRRVTVRPRRRSTHTSGEHAVSGIPGPSQNLETVGVTSLKRDSIRRMSENICQCTPCQHTVYVGSTSPCPKYSTNSQSTRRAVSLSSLQAAATRILPTCVVLVRTQIRPHAATRRRQRMPAASRGRSSSSLKGSQVGHMRVATSHPTPWGMLTLLCKLAGSFSPEIADRGSAIVVV